MFANPTPYHVTVVALAGGANRAAQPLDPVMVNPKSTASVPFSASAAGGLFVTHVDDYGGQVTVEYACDGNACRSVKR
ncbi:gram-negative pili assembly chaperone, C-terminal domain protein [Burkholderia thailandensis E254]|nr:gram-negative pili assembly chaperone, C-terminal domain protein [Burkholderia thailandensis E254]